MKIDGNIGDFGSTITISYESLPITIYTTHHPSKETDWGYTEPEYDEVEDTKDWDLEVDLNDFIFDVAPVIEEIPEDIYYDDEACKKWVEDNFNMIKEKYKDRILELYYKEAQEKAEEHANDYYDPYNESLNKKGEKKMKKKLTEARWQHTVPGELAARLRKSINKEDYEEVKKAMKDIYDDIYNHLGGEVFDEDDLIQYKDEIDEVAPDEDEIDYLLTNLYDFCDNLRIWIPTDGMFDDDDEDEEEESEFDFDDDIDLTWRDELEDDIYADDLDEDVHEADSNQDQMLRKWDSILHILDSKDIQYLDVDSPSEQFDSECLNLLRISGETVAGLFVEDDDNLSICVGEELIPVDDGLPSGRIVDQILEDLRSRKIKIIRGHRKDLDEDMHEAEVHLDVDTDEEESDEDDFRAKDPDTKVLNEKPLKEWASFATHHYDRIMRALKDKVLNKNKLIEVLLKHLEDSELGKIADKLGIADFEETYDDDDLDGLYTDDDLDEDLGDIISGVGKVVSSLNPMKNILGESKQDYIGGTFDNLFIKHLRRLGYKEDKDNRQRIDDQDVYTYWKGKNKSIFVYVNDDGKITSIDGTLEESLREDTVKQDGKWTNKGKEGTHGTFRTKKAADAQRKAMFANGYEEDMDIGKGIVDNVVKPVVKKAVDKFLGEDIDDSFGMPEKLPESFLRTFQQEKPLEEGVNVNVNVEDNVTTTTTVTAPSEGGLAPNDETKMSAEDYYVVDADDDIEGLDELL